MTVTVELEEKCRNYKGVKVTVGEQLLRDISDSRSLSLTTRLLIGVNYIHLASQPLIKLPHYKLNTPERHRVY